MTPPSMGGDCDLREASRRVGDKLFFIGGFDQNAGFENGTPQRRRGSWCIECFEATKDHAGYICAPVGPFLPRRPREPPGLRRRRQRMRVLNVVNADQAARRIIFRSPSLHGVAGAAWNLVVIGLWLWLYRPIYDNLATIFTREDFRTNQVALLGVLVLIGLRLRREHLRPRLSAKPRPHAAALALAIGGSLAFVAVERFLDVNVVAMCLFGLASYGLLGLWMPPAMWRRGLPAALLLVAVLPFGDLIDVFVGYPMRIATASVVRDGLAAAGVGSYGIDTILVFENGISQVDLLCT